MGIPTLQWECAFGNLPNDTTYTWTDISQDVAENQFTRGKDSDLDTIQAGTGSLTILDDLGKYDPRHASSPYYPNVRPWVPIRQIATLDGITYPLCVHYVEEWPRSRVVAMITRALKTIDGLAILAAAPLAGLSIAQGTTDTHVTAVLDYIGWPAGRRNIGSGSATIVAQDFAVTDTTLALPYLQAVASNEAGFLFIDGAGEVTFLGRADLLGPPFNSISARFTDDPTDEGAYLYEAGEVSTYGDDRIFNDWTGTRPNGGTPQQASDATSISRYGDRPPPSNPIQTLLTNDSDVLATVQAYLSYYMEPRERLASIVLAPGEDSAEWHTVLALEVGDRVAVTQTFEYGDQRTDDYLIERVTLTRGPGSDAAARVQYSLWPVEAAGVPSGLKMDDAVLGKFNTGTMGF